MKITESYNIFNECVNALELIISLFLLTSILFVFMVDFFLVLFHFM